MKYVNIVFAEFQADTGHLTPQQVGLYFRLLFCYYETELPLRKADLRILKRKIGVTTEQQNADLLIVLEEFFTPKNGAYVHARCEREIARYLTKTARARKAGKASGVARNGKKRKKINDQFIYEFKPPFVYEQTFNQVQLKRTSVPASSTNCYLLFVICYLLKLKPYKPNRSLSAIDAPVIKLFVNRPAQKTNTPTKKPEPIEAEFIPADKPKPKRALTLVQPKAIETALANYRSIAEWMAEDIRRSFPNQKINISDWADCIRKIITIDQKTESELRTLWIWIRNHDNGNFSWADNCRTPLKLRRRNDGLPYFDLIQNQMIRERAQTKPQSKTETVNEYVTGAKRNDW